MLKVVAVRLPLTSRVPPLEPDDVLPEPIPLDVVYEDGDLLIVNKPKGMTVHPAPHVSSGTLVNALLHHCGASLSGINGVMRLQHGRGWRGFPDVAALQLFVQAFDAAPAGRAKLSGAAKKALADWGLQ